MELPRPRPFGTEGKDRTLDFLSLHGHSSFQHQDPRAQRVYLETQDFLRPLEQVEKNINNGKAENKSKTATVEKLPPPSSSSPSSSAEHILPGGIGTYSISHISNFIQRVPKAEQIPGSAVDRASSVERNCEPNRAANSSIRNNYGGGVFTTLWDEAAVLKKGGSSSVKDTAGERQVLREAAEKAGGQWPSERTLQTPYVHRNSFSSLSTSKQSAAKNNNNKSFLEMMKSGRGVEDDEDEAGEEFTSKKAVSSSHQEGKNVDQKANNTPRSKHSATEQRRRSKINDRFQILRDLIPQNDQKRDKASFLLEVIDYIQFLQEKVHRYESSYQGWNQEPVKLTPWRNGHGPGESMVDHSRAVKSAPSPALMFTGKFDDSNIAASPTTLANTHNSVEPDLSTSATYKPLDHHVGLANKAVPMKPNSFTPVGGSDGLAHPLQRPDAENMASQHQSQLWQSRPCVTEFPVTGDVLNEQEELTVEGGTISISGVYSQGLLNNLTQALQGLGVDLSQASISVQVDLGKRANRRLTSTTSGAKDHEDPCNNNRTMAREDLDQSLKRRKTE